MGKESKKSRVSRTGSIYLRLFQEFPDASCALNHKNPLELLIATILSAQCTDKKVNAVTPNLFLAYPRTIDYAQAPLEDLEGAIRSIGLFRSKARNIQSCCQTLENFHQGQVPDSMDQLITLAGVGRKTANVVLSNIFGKNEGVVVDTHVRRISKLLGLTTKDTPEKIEPDLMALIPQADWGVFSHLLILHGRKTCIARRPRCADCSVKDFCRFYKTTV
jgi:endonuclease III